MRPAKFGGSWYDNNESSLRTQIQVWLDGAEILVKETPKIIVVPHAGYVYSGSTAAYGYKMLQRSNPRRLILLGPSHRYSIGDSILMSPFEKLDTPFGPLSVDIRSRLCESIKPARKSIDTMEHSLEMQFPFIKYCCPNVAIIPIIVGRQGNNFINYTSILAEELKKDDTLIIVSSDFCHWGSSYQYYPRLEQYEGTTIGQRIRSLDLAAVESIFSGDPKEFSNYLKKTGNTICGQGPILLAMEIIKQAELVGRWELLHYNQSSHIKDYDPSESSVSYITAAFLTG